LPGKAGPSAAIDGDNVRKKRWKGMALAMPKACPMEKGFSPGQPRLKPFPMESDFAGLKPSASTALQGAPEGCPFKTRQTRLFLFSQ